ncbi:MAG TPA: aspartate aminotransferase family protein [Conexibacter sp.]|jgi:putrescine aminotransferase|nr:aspartate aminotransferase family protein [Conexibacter sp.]
MSGAALWHPFADMGAAERERLTLVRGEGAWVWDDAGRRYLDATASLWYANLGHGRPEIAEAVQRQLATLDAYNIFGDYANEPALELADRIAALAPTAGSRVFLGAGGGDMIDGAAKLARRFHAERGEPRRVHLIGREHGYHGTHGVGTSVGGIAANAAGLGTLVADVSHVPHDDAAALEAEILRVGPERVAAFFCEPVIGAGGVRLPPEGYVERVAEICRRHGVLFVADCVICGFGRLGTWLGIDRWPVAPDLVTLAKGVTGGTLPLGALIVAPHVAEPFFPGAAGAPVFRHGATYAGHPACCAAANVALDIYEREGLIERGRQLERPLADALAPLVEHPLVAEVRAGLGFLAGVELTQEARAADPGAVVRLQLACRAAGVLVRPLGTGIAVSPPLTVGEPEIAELAEAIETSLEALAVEPA